jgi:DNA segregation ATPase FtsK/SpoIIIE, S-DNA-T family
MAASTWTAPPPSWPYLSPMMRGTMLMADPDLPAVLEGSVVERLVNAKRRPVVPVWLRDDVTRRAAVKYGLLHAGHVTWWEITRSPKYVARAVVWSPRGAGRVVGRTAGWALNREVERHKSALIAAGKTDDWLKVDGRTAGTIQARLIALTVICVPSVAGAGLLVALGPLWAQAAAAVTVVSCLGYLGRPYGRPFFDIPVIAARAEKPTPDIVTAALAASVPAIRQALVKDPQAIRFIAPGVGRDGPGWRVDLDLPPGITVLEVAEQRDKLAAALRRPLGCVWPEGDDSEHPGRLVLFIGDKDLSKRGKVSWPLARAGQFDVFGPLPFGIDPRGREVSVPLIGNNTLIGSIMNQGKTAAVRIYACGAALDPTCELWLHELKGTGDLDPLERVAHRFTSGIDDSSIGYTAESLQLLRAEVMRRVDRFKTVPRDLVPDKMVTREVASKRSLGLHPLLCVIDECQNLFGHPQFGKQAGEDAEWLIRVARAVGVFLVLATQRPDKQSLPTGITAMVSIRFCLKVMDQWTNDAILGTSSYQNGIRATLFRPDGDQGNGLLIATKGPQIVRTCYLDMPATERIAVRARALREAAGMVTGHAAGETPEAGPVVSLLADVAAVMHGEERLWSEVICARLAELRPGLYGGWDAVQLGRALAAYGIASMQTWARDGDGQRRNRQGIDRKTVLKALEDKGGLIPNGQVKGI